MKRSNVILAFIIVTLLSACHTDRVVEVPRTSLDTLILVQVQKDSVFLHDSVTIIQRGDTIYYTKFRDRYHLQLSHDTTYIHRIDTLTNTIYVDKPTPYIPTWAKALMIIGALAIVFIIFKML